MNFKHSAVISIFVLSIFCFPASAVDKYVPTWQSLSNHNPAPEWFKDAKIGIYFHWGVYTVPAFGSEWYPRNMHIKTNREYKHHVEKYGDPTKFGYHDFVPMFKAENFDADKWAELFLKAGARFAGPVAEHHDGFSMWDSDVTPWNAKDKGPERDITGLLAKAIKSRNMKFVTTFHHARNNLWQKNPPSWTGHYDHVKTDFPSILDDPERAILYGYMPREDFLVMWKAKLMEVIDKYQPDLMWFDSWLDEIPDQVKMEYIAYYLNKAEQWNKDVVITSKQKDLPQDVGVLDLEKGRMGKMTTFSWLTDDTISLGSWCYTDTLRIKPTKQVLHSLIDIVSKNGVLILNISPMTDGTIPENQQKVLLEMGQWLKVNGQAIYNTRTWNIFGEGPTDKNLPKGHFGGVADPKGGYSPQDIRFTRSKDGRTIYAVTMGRPDAKSKVQLRCFAKDVMTGDLKINNISVLGCREKISYSWDDDGLWITAPSGKTSDLAVVFKIEVTGSCSIVAMGDSIVLDAASAVLDGDKIGLEEKLPGKKNIGFWDDSDESAHWLVKVPQPGSYLVKGRFAATNPSKAMIKAVDNTLVFDIPSTGSWDKTSTIQAGKITFQKAGVYHLMLRSASPTSWKAVNMWQLELIPAH